MGTSAKDTNSANSSDTTKTQNTSNIEDSEEESKKSFTPIQAESSKETYKDTNTFNILALAKSQQMANMLDILFNQKAGENSALNVLSQNMSSNSILSNSLFSNSTFKELQKFANSWGGGIDLKA